MDAAGVSIDLAAAKAHKVVLVEGGRDKAAVEVLAGGGARFSAAPAST